MRNILAKGGVEFLAVFLGIALSLWVDDYREEKELSNRITDDYENIYHVEQVSHQLHKRHYFHLKPMAHLYLIKY